MRRTQLLTSIVFIAMAAIWPSAATAAVQNTVLSIDRAAPGGSVSVRIEMSARWEGTDTTILYLVPRAAQDAGPFARHCDQVPGSVALGEISWRAETVHISAWTGDGYVGDLEFTVPHTTPGEYYVAESTPAINAGCFAFAVFHVTAAALPDTALAAG